MRLFAFLLISAAVCIAVIAFEPVSASALSTTMSGATKAASAPTPPPIAVVTALCVDAGTDMQLTRWNYLGGYLLCETGDANTGGMQLYKRLADGSFKLISHGGGDINPADQVDYYHVPPSIATPLYDGLHP